MAKRHLYIGLTKRKGDWIVLVAIAVLLIVQLIQVVYDIGLKNTECGRLEFVFRPQLILKAIVLYVPPFLVAYGGLIFYLIRDKKWHPKWPKFCCKNDIVATICGIIYFITIILFFLLSLLIWGNGWHWENEVMDDISSGALITLLFGVPVDLIGLILWTSNYGLVPPQKKQMMRQRRQVRM